MDSNNSYSIWTNDQIDQIVFSDMVNNEIKVKILGEYIEWKISNNYVCNTDTYPVINLLAGYYGLVKMSTLDEIKEMMSRDYGIEFTNSINKLTNSDILSGLALFNTMYVLMNYTF